MVGGFADIGLLYRSGAPVAGPLVLARTLTTVTIGIGVGLLGAVTVVTRRHGWRERTTSGEGGPQPGPDVGTEPSTMRPHPDMAG